MITFIGKFHPLFVHLPIGFIAFWLIIEGLERISTYRSGEKTKLILIVASAISSIVSSVLGYMLSLNGEYNGELLDEHKWMGIWLSVLLTIIAFIYHYFKSKSFFKYLYNGSLVGVGLLLTITGHHGGSLTHGEEYLALSQLSETKKAEKIVIKDINQAVVFSQLVQPIINQKCISCHNASKMKGGLRMDSFEEIMKGGENGVIVKAGNSSQSELMKLVNLDPSEERAMPPKGKTPLTSDEKQVLAWWIDAGATKDKKVSELKPDAKTLTLLKKFEDGAVDETKKLPEVSKVEEKTLAEISKLGININPISKESNLLDVRCIINKLDWNDKKTESLLKIKEQLYILDLSGTAISNKSLATIGQFKSIQTLLLQSTQLNDDDFEILKGLENLESLNLYNTQITDKAIANISLFKKLKKLYIWQTKITEKGIEQLQKKLPDLQIVAGKKYINS